MISFGREYLLDLPVVLAMGKSRNVRNYNLNGPRIRHDASKGDETPSLEKHRRVQLFALFLILYVDSKTIQICLAGIPLQPFLT